VGAVLGNVVFTAVAAKVPRFPVFAVGFLLAGSPRFVVLAVTDRPWVAYGVGFVAGLSVAAVNPIIGALSYERVPRHLHARVLGLSHALAWAGIPLGGLLGGLAVEQLRLSAAALLFGAVYLAVTLLPFLDRSWRDMDREESAADAVDGGRPSVRSGHSAERIGQ
jgi:predicted MFS family arabinose efflux permease